MRGRRRGRRRGWGLEKIGEVEDGGGRGCEKKMRTWCVRGVAATMLERKRNEEVAKKGRKGN